MADTLPVESYEDIPYYDSGLRRRTIPDHPRYHQPARLAGFGLQCLRYEHRLKSQAEPPPLDAALAQ